MTSVCHVKTAISHKALISSSMSSLPTYEEDDFESEKNLHPDFDKTNPMELASTERPKLEAESSEFSIANILGISQTAGDKQSKDRSRSLLGDSKWPKSEFSCTNQTLSDYANQQEEVHSPGKESFNDQNKNCFGFSHKLENLQIGDSENNTIADVISEEKCKRMSTASVLKQDEVLVNSKEFKNQFTNDDDAIKEQILKNSEGETANYFNKDISRQHFENIFSEKDPNMKWVTALNNYYGTFTPAWKIWQDFLYRRAIPSTASPSPQQYPIFHPYARRSSIVGNPGQKMFNLFSSFPFRLEASKMNNISCSSKEGIFPPENFSSIKKSRKI